MFFLKHGVEQQHKDSRFTCHLFSRLRGVHGSKKLVTE